MKRQFLILLLLSTGLWQTHAQRQAQPEPSDRKGKIFLIPEFWLSFGSSTYIEIATLVGYHVNDRLVVGAGPHYIYQSWKFAPPYPSVQSHVFGLKGFTRFAVITNAEEFLPFNLFSDLFVHFEYEGLNMQNGIYNSSTEDSRYIQHLFLIGGGFNQRISMHSSVSFMVLWNLDESSPSPYSNPIFRLGFNAYF